MPDLETVIPVWEHVKRTLVPEQDTNAVCMAFSSISAPDLETMIPIREHYNFFLPEFIIQCIPSEGYLTYLFCVCGCCYAEYYINPYEMYKLLIQQYSQKYRSSCQIVSFVYAG